MNSQPLPAPKPKTINNRGNKSSSHLEDSISTRPPPDKAIDGVTGYKISSKDIPISPSGAQKTLM